ncbi:MAG: hypothetical protein EF806_02455 [Candidatus Methanoliparum thermophilum]|uniref:Uncharacterized protein n=1 Tax=Methanoliparum thermophilum TaxID=2491083 RepID=A0A520KSM5_METT2|nr:hypothetical protein [Candidatus Methanoliparum sp. LAM-1]RZN64923.1 MAG: hypothetical protein EF806_02455 [Candidatus Methanoliparum thermophilum]BDC36197.1 hypothetical protein MTLP_08790 [Candidatus Methanoliparum sp. LAM-1]
MFNSFTITRYKVLNAFHMIFKSKGTVIGFIIFYILMGGILITISYYISSMIDLFIKYLPIIFGIVFIIPIMNAFRGRGLRAPKEDADFVLTTSVNPREYFMSIQFTSISTIILFILPIIFLCIIILLHNLGIQLYLSIPLALSLVFFIGILNMVAAGIRMVIENRRSLIIVLPIIAIIGSIFYFLSPSLLYNILPNFIISNLTIETLNSNLSAVLIYFLALVLWYLLFVGIFFYSLRSQYDFIVKPIEDSREKKPLVVFSMIGSTIGVLIKKEFLSIVRTRVIYTPLLYLFIFLLLPLFRMLPGSDIWQGFGGIIFITILFMVMGTSAMVQRRFAREKNTIWIQKTLPIKKEQIVDSISFSATIVGMIYSIIVLIILSLIFGSNPFPYTPLIFATSIISANFAVYQNITSPTPEDMSFPPNMPYIMLLSILLVTPCYIPVLYMPLIAEYAGIAFNSTTILLISFFILIYAIPVSLILRKMSAKKLIENEELY